ncbi:Gag-Pol polyprotein, partial [Mucuna pruriens]
MPIRDKFPNEQLLQINMPTPWFVDICNFVAISQFPPEASRLYKERLKSDAKYYIWDDTYLWRLYNDQVIRRSVPDTEINSVLYFCHAAFGDVWGIDFMGLFSATKTDDAKVVVDFLKSNIFYQFGVSKVLISDQGSHFCNKAMSNLLHKYGVVHRVATTYHPQTNSEAKVFNKEIKKTLQKMANPNRKDWSRLLEDALWGHKTTD